MFDVPIEQCQALVVDPEHLRYGQQAKIIFHDWQESGEMMVEFPDGHQESLHDGGVIGDPAPQVFVFKRTESKKLQDVISRLGKIREKLRGLKVVAGDRDLPPQVRQEARRSFFNFVLKGEPVPSFS